MAKEKRPKKQNPGIIEPFTWKEEELEEMREELYNYDTQVLGLDEKIARMWTDLTIEVKKNPDLEPAQIVEEFKKKHS